MAYAWMWWIAAAVVFFVLEAATVNLITIWMGVSALVSAVLSVWVPFVPVQLTLFLVLTLVLIYFTRPMVIKHLKPKATNAPALKGREAIVTLPIDMEAGTGQVRLEGNIWTARAAREEEVIKTGQRVIVKEIRGVTLIVERKEGA